MRIYILLSFLMISCTPGGQRSSGSEGKQKKKIEISSDANGPDGTTITETSNTGDSTPPVEQGTGDWEKDPEKNVINNDNRPMTQIMCEDGQGIANAKDTDDFTSLFDVICADGATTDTWDALLADAYDSSTDPEVMFLTETTNELYVTEMLFAYAIKAPLDSPAQFADMNIYDRLEASGIESEQSKLVTTVMEREEFAGKGSVERYSLQHNIHLAEAASLHDVRNTQINNYLLAEHTRDITLSTEHLLDEDNEHYHIARGILVGVKGDEPGTTYLVYVNELVAKNRIDPKRLVNTIRNLSIATQRIIYEQTLTVDEE